jgi:hypothetical protein
MKHRDLVELSRQMRPPKIGDVMATRDALTEALNFRCVEKK